MCCLFCVEVAKENVKPKEFWKLFTEISQSEDQKHMDELLKAVRNTSQEFQTDIVLNQLGEGKVKQYE